MSQNKKYEIHSFDSLDLYTFNQVVHSWNTDFLQLNPGKFSSDLMQLIAEDMQLGYASFNTSIKQEGFSPPGVWTFAFVNDVKLYWRNYVVQPKSVIIYAPESEINAVSDAGFEVLTFSITDHDLMQYAKLINEEEFYNNLKTEEVLVTNNTILWDELRSSIFSEITNYKTNKEIQYNSKFKDDFIKKLFPLLKDSNHTREKVSGLKRLKMLQETEKFVLERITEPIKITSIANKLKVSERTLLYAFNKRFNMGPKKFILVLKLNHVYLKLQQEKNGKAITQIAKESGFWHMGQFYKDFKNHFGVIPSYFLKK